MQLVPGPRNSSYLPVNQNPAVLPVAPAPPGAPGPACPPSPSPGARSPLLQTAPGSPASPPADPHQGLCSLPTWPGALSPVSTRLPPPPSHPWQPLSRCMFLRALFLSDISISFEGAGHIPLPGRCIPRSQNRGWYRAGAREPRGYRPCRGPCPTLSTFLLLCVPHGNPLAGQLQLWTIDSRWWLREQTGPAPCCWPASAPSHGHGHALPTRWVGLCRVRAGANGPRLHGRDPRKVRFQARQVHRRCSGSVGLRAVPSDTPRSLH